MLRCTPSGKLRHWHRLDDRAIARGRVNDARTEREDNVEEAEKKWRTIVESERKNQPRKSRDEEEKEARGQGRPQIDCIQYKKESWPQFPL